MSDKAISEKTRKLFTERFNKLLAGKKQEEFATLTGLARPTVGLYASGKRIADTETLLKIARSCKVSTDWLLGLVDDPSPDPDMQATIQHIGLSQGAIDRLAGCAAFNQGFYCESFLDGENIPTSKEYLRILSWLITSNRFFSDGMLGSLADMAQADADAAGREPKVTMHNPGLKDEDTSIILRGEAMGDYLRRDAIDEITELIATFRAHAKAQREMRSGAGDPDA